MFVNLLKSKKAGTINYIFNGVALLLIFVGFIYFIVVSKPSNLISGFDESEVKADTIVFNFNSNCIDKNSNLVLDVKEGKANCINLDEKSFLKGGFDSLDNTFFYAGNQSLENDESFCDYKGSLYCFEKKIPVIEKGEFKVLHLKGILK